MLPLRLVAGVDVCFMLPCLSVPALGLVLFSLAHRGHTVTLVQSLQFQPVVATLLVAEGSPRVFGITNRAGDAALFQPCERLTHPLWGPKHQQLGWEPQCRKGIGRRQVW